MQTAHYNYYDFYILQPFLFFFFSLKLHYFCTDDCFTVFPPKEKKSGLHTAKEKKRSVSTKKQLHGTVLTAIINYNKRQENKKASCQNNRLDSAFPFFTPNPCAL